MLQDLSYGRLENEFRALQPEEEDFLLCFSGNRLLLKRGQGREAFLPTIAQSRLWTAHWTPWFSEGLRYVFRMQERNYFLWLGEVDENISGEYGFEPLRPLRDLVDKDLCFAAMTGWHLYSWYRSNRICGSCGSATVHDSDERMLRCDHCGNRIYPKISPAVIVAVTDGDRLLMSKYAGRDYTHYALIAGYTEIGETIEQTVAREVMEEVGLRVKNLRYYKSQPWGVDGTVLMGFFCDLDGDDTIHLDMRELSMAQWHHRDAIPAKDDHYSLTREMIRVFQEGKEPL